MVTGRLSTVSLSPDITQVRTEPNSPFHSILPPSVRCEELGGAHLITNRSKNANCLVSPSACLSSLQPRPADHMITTSPIRLPQQGASSHLLRHQDLRLHGRVCRGRRGGGGGGRQGGGGGAEALVFWCAGIPGGQGPRSGPRAERDSGRTRRRRRAEADVQRRVLIITSVFVTIT